LKIATCWCSLDYSASLFEDLKKAAAVFLKENWHLAVPHQIVTSLYQDPAVILIALSTRARVESCLLLLKHLQPLENSSQMLLPIGDLLGELFG
jgi:hypothetical protein